MILVGLLPTVLYVTNIMRSFFPEPSEQAPDSKAIPCTKMQGRKQKGRPQHQKKQNRKATLLEKVSGIVCFEVCND